METEESSFQGIAWGPGDPPRAGERPTR
jgi:hypothetical protein